MLLEHPLPPKAAIRHAKRTGNTPLFLIALPLSHQFLEKQEINR